MRALEVVETAVRRSFNTTGMAGPGFYGRAAGIVLGDLEKAGLRIVHASALGNEAVARADVEAVLAHLVENGRTALDTSAGHAYRESASKVEELLGRPSQGLPRVNDVLDGA